MTYEEVAIAETEFAKNGQALGRNYRLTPFAIPFGNNENLNGFTCRPQNGFTGYFENEKQEKEKIVLHFTVGHLKGDILSLTSEERGRVSTAFVLSRDGNIYQLFSSATWSYHLGRTAIGGNGNQSKLSIGIELSNYGPLIKNGNNLETIYSKDNRKDIYCSIEDKEQYIELDEPFRGYKYYTAFTDEQYNSLIILLRYLTTLYNIPREFVPADIRFEDTAAASSEFKGICSHVNFRDDKMDIGPAFDWERLITGVQAEKFPVNLKLDLKAAEQELELAKAALAAAQINLGIAQAKVESIINRI